MSTLQRMMTRRRGGSPYPKGSQMWDTGVGASPELGQVVVGTGFSRSGGEIVQAATGVSAFVTSQYWKKADGSGFTRANGLAFVGDVRGNGMLGWTTSTTIGGGNTVDAYSGLGTAFTGFLSATTPTGMPTRTPVQVASILLGTGAIITMNGVVQWYHDVNAGATLYPLLTHGFAGNPAGAYSNLGVVDLTSHESKWGALSTLCDSYATSPTAGNQYTHSRSGFIRWTMTGQTGVTQSIKFRVVDANNYWVIELAQGAPGSISLYEVVAGVKSAALKTYSTTIANGTAYKISIMLNGRSVRCWIGTGSGISTAFRYDAMRTALTGTGLILSHAGANLVVLPAYLPLPAAVQRERIVLAAQGDSKVLGTGDTVSGESGGYPPDLVDLVGSSRILELTPRGGVSGRTTATWNSFVAGGVAPTYAETFFGDSNLCQSNSVKITLTHSVNDVSGSIPGTIPAEATFKADYGAIIAAARDANPSAALMTYKKVWKASGTYPGSLADGYTASQTLDTWRDDVCTPLGYIIDGPDERALLKRNDNGLSRTGDGIHGNSTYYGELAADIKSKFGM